MAAARTTERLAEVASKFGESVRTVPLDVTNEAQAKNAVEAAIETFGCVDVLVNNAGYGNGTPWKILRSRIFAHRLKRICSVSSL